jgi:hypothetical protein
MVRVAPLAVCIALWTMNTSVSEGQTRRNPTPVTDARICEVAVNPDTFNHKRIRLSGVVTQEFEHFGIADPSCTDAQDAAQIWLTFGGRVSAGVMYCCPGEGDRRRRPRDVIVEGLTIPLVEDPTLARFMRLLRSNDTFAGRATLVGTFFAGQGSERVPTLRGYGHLGCCALFVIERVEQVAPLSASPK